MSRRPSIGALLSLFRLWPTRGSTRSYCTGPRRSAFGQLFQRRNEMNSAPGTADGERGARQQRSDTGADRIGAAPFIGEADADCSRDVGSSPRFSRNVKNERRINRLVETDHGVDARGAIGDRAGSRGDMNAVTARTASGRPASWRDRRHRSRRPRHHLSASLNAQVRETPRPRSKADSSWWRWSRGLCTGGGSSTEERAACRRRRRHSGRIRWPRVLRRRGANSDSFGETFGVDATEQLDGDVDVSISSAWYDRRRKVVTLHHSHRVTAPAKPDTDAWLRTKTHFVGVNSYQQQHIGRSCSRAAHSEPGGIRASSR